MADGLGIDVIQIHVSSPRTWQAPRPRADAAELAASGRLVAVHAPYLCNPASSDPTVRDRSRVLLQQTCDAAADVGAGGVVVHAGQAGAGSCVDAAVARWLDMVDHLDTDVPLLIENTASGQASVGRHTDSIATLFAALRGAGTAVQVGACLDTAHAFAADQAAAKDPAGWVREFAAATGGIDLVHVNDSASPAGSGRDRHANLGAGEMGLATIAAMLGAADAPAAVLETPGYDERRRRDLEILRYLVATAPGPGST
ncbi:MAG TPA: TIM barrel protein [Euzebyales bacterium]